MAAKVPQVKIIMTTDEMPDLTSVTVIALSVAVGVGEIISVSKLLEFWAFSVELRLGTGIVADELAE